MRLWISVSHFLASVKIFSRYLCFSTCLIFISPVCNSQVGPFYDKKLIGNFFLPSINSVKHTHRALFFLDTFLITLTLRPTHFTLFDPLNDFLTPLLLRPFSLLHTEKLLTSISPQLLKHPIRHLKVLYQIYYLLDMSHTPNMIHGKKKKLAIFSMLYFIDYV